MPFQWDGEQESRFGKEKKGAQNLRRPFRQENLGKIPPLMSEKTVGHMKFRLSRYNKEDSIQINLRREGEETALHHRGKFGTNSRETNDWGTSMLFRRNGLCPYGKNASELEDKSFSKEKA